MRTAAFWAGPFHCEVSEDLQTPRWTEEEKNTFILNLKKGRSGLVTWKWREENPNRVIDLSDTDLRGLNLGQADLRDAWLVRANLTDCDLTGARLENVKASGANFTEADLNSAHCEGIFAEHAYFFGAKAPGAHFQNAKLHFTIFDCCVLTDAEFDDAYTHGTFVHRSKIEGASFANVKMGNISGLGTCRGMPAVISAAGLRILRGAQDEHMKILP